MSSSSSSAISPRGCSCCRRATSAARAAAPRNLDVVDVVSDGGRTRLETDVTPIEFEPGGARRRRAAAPHERHDEPAEAGAVAPAKPDGHGARRSPRTTTSAPDDVSYCVMPLFHIHGLVASTFAALAAGGSVVVPRRLRAAALLAAGSRRGVTWFSAGPTLHQMLLESGRRGAPATLRFVRSCSSALAPELMRSGWSRRTACRCSRRTG